MHGFYNMCSRPLSGWRKEPKKAADQSWLSSFNVLTNERSACCWVKVLDRAASPRDTLGKICFC